jgi:hypothetical protein
MDVLELVTSGVLHGRTDMTLARYATEVAVVAACRTRSHAQLDHVAYELRFSRIIRGRKTGVILSDP